MHQALAFSKPPGPRVEHRPLLRQEWGASLQPRWSPGQVMPSQTHHNPEIMQDPSNALS
jgi:hypothetical protein